MGVALAVGLSLVACAPPPPKPAPKAGEKPEGYDAAVRRLADMVNVGNQFFANGRPDDASRVISDGLLMQNQILSVPQLDLAGTVAVSDLDDLYGRMLLASRHYGDARLLFQKNLARWRMWKPQNEESAKQLKHAQDQIAECDKHILQ